MLLDFESPLYSDQKFVHGSDQACTYIFSSLLVISHQLEVGFLLMRDHRHLDHFFRLLWQICQNFRFESSKEKRFHDAFCVSDSIFLVLGTLVVVALVALKIFREFFNK